MDEVLRSAEINRMSIFEFTKKEDKKLCGILCEKYPKVAKEFLPAVDVMIQETSRAFDDIFA